LPVLVLDPRGGENILDMCAAPGSKTTQMAALMQNQGTIVAIEAVRNRYYKLKAVTSLLGVENVIFKLMDGRSYRAREQLFDKILVDAPCSCEGRFKVEDPKTYRYWSLRKIREMTRKQKGLLLNASRLLKPEGRLVYATCTFAPEENEEVLNWLLKKTAGTIRVDKIHIKDISAYPARQQWQGKTFDRQIENCLRILPDEKMEGFFIAKLQKVV